MIGRTLITPDLVGSISEGAIIGEPAIPHAAVVLGSGDYLETGDLAPADSGDAGGIAGFAIEGWIQVRTYPGTVSDIFSGPTGGGGAVQWRLRLNPTGTLTAVQRTGSVGANTYTATTSQRLLRVSDEEGLTEENQFWHVVAANIDNTLRIYINGVLAALVDPTVDVMPSLDANSGMRIGEANALGMEIAVDEVAFYRSGLSTDRWLAHYEAGRRRGFRDHLSGDRVHAILDSAGITIPRRIDTGVRTIEQVYLQGQSPIEAIRTASSGEAVETMFFISRDGALVFLDSDHRSSAPYNTVQATFDDDGTDLPYADLTIDYSESFLGNEWHATRTGGDAVTQTASDPVSIAKYRKRSNGISVPVTTDGAAATIAAALLEKYKDPMTRITSITLTTALADVAEAIFRCDLGDRIRVFRTPPGGGARIDQTLFIQKINIQAANDGRPWTVIWGLSPL